MSQNCRKLREFVNWLTTHCLFPPLWRLSLTAMFYFLPRRSMLPFLPPPAFPPTQKRSAVKAPSRGHFKLWIDGHVAIPRICISPPSSSFPIDRENFAITWLASFCRGKTGLMLQGILKTTSRGYRLYVLQVSHPQEQQGWLTCKLLKVVGVANERN